MGNWIDYPCAFRIRPETPVVLPSFPTRRFSKRLDFQSDSSSAIDQLERINEKLARENQLLRERVAHLETADEWSRMDAIEQHYRNIHSPVSSVKGDSDDEDAATSARVQTPPVSAPNSATKYYAIGNSPSSRG